MGVKKSKYWFLLVGAVYVIFIIYFNRPTFNLLILSFVDLSGENWMYLIAIRSFIIALVLGLFYVFLKGNWKQLLLVIIFYFVFYFVEGNIWFYY
ncbi:MAG: hypothetical protein DCO96_12645 [Fluviicola sp. XM-24bin1]|nr:MAG: hypothetical protein DCO96_12645 [Fluviicola sp. XM-24bin1]